MSVERRLAELRLEEIKTQYLSSASSKGVGRDGRMTIPAYFLNKFWMRKKFYGINDGILFACKRVNMFGYDVVDLAEQQVPIFYGNKVYELVIKGNRIKPQEELRDFLTGDLRYIGRSNFIEIWREEDLDNFFKGIRKSNL